MLAFWVALAVMGAVVAFGIVTLAPWVESVQSVWYGSAAALATFAALLGREAAYLMRPELFGNGGDLRLIQGLVFGLGLGAAIVSWVCKGISMCDW